MRYKFLKGKLNPAKKLLVRRKISKSKLGRLNPNWREHKENICVICSKKFLPKSDQRNKTCSPKCLRELQSKNNGMKRKLVIDKMKKTNAKLRRQGKRIYWMETEEGKKRISKIARKKALTNNPMWDRGISLIVANKTRERMLKEYANGTRTPKTYHYHNYKKKDGSIVKLQSSYELAFAKYLDRNNIKWICHHEKNFPRLTYILENREHTYFADFFIPKTNELIDVKSSYIFGRTKEINKIMAVRKYNPKIYLQILTEKNLLDLLIHPREINYVTGKKYRKKTTKPSSKGL